LSWNSIEVMLPSTHPPLASIHQRTGICTALARQCARFGKHPPLKIDD
jgi:hypothetical protein